jgi:hypothetical protein
LAAKYGRSHQAVKQFSARNAAEIATRRQVLLGEVDAEGAHLWVSDKVTRRAAPELIEDLEIRLADEGLDPRLRSRYTRDIDMLLHRVAEEKGELPTRSTVELTEVPVLSHIIEGFDRDKWLTELLEARRNPPAPAEPDASNYEEPARKAPAPGEGFESVGLFRAVPSPAQGNGGTAAAGAPAVPEVAAVQAARELAIQVWGSGLLPRARANDQHLALAVALKWLGCG